MTTRPKIFIAFVLITAVILFFGGFTGKDVDESPHVYKLTYPEAFGKPKIPADNPMTEEGVWLGRLLFYDPILSINNKMSCGTCHQQKLYFSDGRALAIGVHGDTLKRNTMALMNLAWGEHFFWDGRSASLEALVKEPIQNSLEMGGLKEDSLVARLKAHKYYPTLFRKAFPRESISLITVSKAVAQFMRTLVTKLNNTEETYKEEKGPSSQRYITLITEDSPLGTAARVSVMQCKSCHTSAAFGGQTMSVYENDSVFKATSLINIKYTAPYMHDGRFKTMREVFEFYNDSMEALLKENPDLVLYQTKITKFTEYDLEHADEVFAQVADTTISTNPLFSDPFSQKGFTWYGIKIKENDGK